MFTKHIVTYAFPTQDPTQTHANNTRFLVDSSSIEPTGPKPRLSPLVLVWIVSQIETIFLLNENH